MKQSRWIVMGVVAALAAGEIGAQDSVDRVTVPFSDPSRPGTLVVKLVSGGMTVRAADRRDVAIESEPEARPRGRDADANASGLRRLNSPSGLVVEEENNQMTVRTGTVSGRATLQLLVPTRTNLKLSAVNGGAIVVEGVQGTIEATNVNGSIALTDVAGSVVAHATNGRVVATIRQIAPDTPMAFTSFNGNVDVTLPSTTEANVRLRTDQGDVFSDFEIQLRPGAGSPVVRQSRPNDGRYRVEVDRTIYGSINGGGPEFELRTFNGNVYLRRGAQ